MDPTTLLRSVEEEFERAARGLEQWDDPHPPPNRVVADEEYSRVTNPAKWRIIGARVHAWLDVLTTAGLATVDRDARVAWEQSPAPALTGIDVVRPAVSDGLALVVGRSRIGTVDDAGVVLGVGLPAVAVEQIPDCGCDACDSGSADVIDQVDTWVGGIVRGELRHLVRPRRTITVIGDDVRRSSHTPRLPKVADGWRWAVAPDDVDVGVLDEVQGRRRSARIDIDAVLADPAGWREWSGPSWLA